MKRICAVCKQAVEINKENTSKAILYKKKFYHYGCFSELCDQKMVSKRASSDWAVAKERIDTLVEETTISQKEAVAEDEIYHWMIDKYSVSIINQRLFMKLKDIYSGKMHGLAYPIPASELMDEWKYYWDELCDIRRYKRLTGEQAINYDLAVLLGKNVEYRDMLVRKNVQEVARLVRQNTDVEIDSAAFEIMQSNSSRETKGNRRAELFKEVMGDGY